MVSQRNAEHAKPTSPTLSDLCILAASLHVTVHMQHLNEPELLGFYDPEATRIYLDYGLSPAEQRSVLAHELGHVHYGHDCDSARSEREADAWAADLLIDATIYAQLERSGHDPHQIADELNVTIEVVRDFQRYCMQQLGLITYGRRFTGRFTNALARALAG